MSKIEQAEQLIEMALRDGEWHPSAPIRDRLHALGLNLNANVNAAKERLAAMGLRVESSKQPGVMGGPWGWQIVNSSNSTPVSDSSAPRATLDPDSDSSTENGPNPNNDRRVKESAEFERTAIWSAEESRVSLTSRARAPARGGRRLCRPRSAPRPLGAASQHRPARLPRLPSNRSPYPGRGGMSDGPSNIGPVPRIALTREEAAAALGIGLDSFERYVQSHVRLIRWGRLRLVPVSELQRFADEAAEKVL